MPAAEIWLTAPTVCTHCGNFYYGMVIHRSGQEAIDLFKSKLGGTPAELEALGKTIEGQIAAGGLVPAKPEEVPVLDQNVKSYSFEPTTCSECNYMNAHMGVAMAFTCDECGRDTHFPTDNTRPKQVTCQHCKTVHDADWSSV